MAVRSMWSGKLAVNALFGADVSIITGSVGDPDDEGMREICSCHQLPMSRQTVCQVTGARRLTKAMRDAGDTDNTTELVKGVERDGKYFVIDADQLALINEAVSSKVIQAVGCVPASQAPFEQVNATYYVRAQPGSEPALAAIHHALVRMDAVLVGQFTARTRQKLVLIHPTDDVLVMNVVRYTAEWQQPDEKCAAHLVADPDDQVVELATQLLGGLDATPDWDGFADKAVGLRAAAITAVVAGKKPKTITQPADAPKAVDTLAALQAALGGAGAKPAAKTTRARKAPAVKKSPAASGTRSKKS